MSVEEYDRGDIHLCVVDAPTSRYIIEPIRFDRHLSRVEMVDDHLTQLVRDHRGHHPDADVLLEARGEFSLAESARAEVTQ